jgi:hypothetical protein
MGIRDRPSEPPDVPDEAGVAKGGSPAENAPAVPNLDRLSDEDLRSAFGRDDPTDVDYLSFDPRFERGQTVIIGKTGSPDNPKRYAEIRDDDQVVDLDTEEPLPDLPTGEDLIEPGEKGRSKYDKILEAGKKPETVENIDDASKEITRLVNEWIDQPRPTGSYQGTPDRPAVYQEQPQGIDGAIALAPVVLWLVAHYGVRSGLDRFNEWKQSRGSQADAGD